MSEVLFPCGKFKGVPIKIIASGREASYVLWFHQNVKWFTIPQELVDMAVEQDIMNNPWFDDGDDVRLD